MKEVRLGLIGCGGMGVAHTEVFKDVPRLRFTAASDSSAANLEKVVSKFGVQGFNDGMELINSGLVDAVLIATPHREHPLYATAALKRGLHVLTEKPVAVTAKAAAEVDRVRAKTKLVYGVVYQTRFMPRWIKAREIIKRGDLGPIRRVLWCNTGWYRTQAYYNSAPWRGKWAGEGGGLLITLCPHNFDMLYWLLGQPKRVRAQLSLGKYHEIEVEDDVTATFEYPNGATGVFIASTGEAAGTDYLEIIGDRGKLVIGKNLEFTQTDQSVEHYTHNSQTAGALHTTRIVYEYADPAFQSNVRALQQNFINAILDGEELIAPAAEGLHSLELSNAIMMSGLTGKAVDIPMDREAFDALMKKLVKKSGKK